MTVNSSFLLGGVPGRQIDLVDEDASKMVVHIWRLEIFRTGISLVEKTFHKHPEL